MSADLPEITGEKFRIWLRPDGVCEIVWAPHVPSELEDAVAVIDAMSELTGGHAAPLLVHTEDAGPQSRAARMEFIRRQEVVSAVALLVGNPLSRMMATFFINVSKPEVPIRLFEDEAAALAWLKEHLAWVRAPGLRRETLSRNSIVGSKRSFTSFRTSPRFGSMRAPQSEPLATTSMRWRQG